MEFLRILGALSHGALNTLSLALASMALGLAGGTALVLARQIAGPRGSSVLRKGVYAVQSVPSLVLIFMAMFGLPRIGILLPPFLTVVLCLGLIASAYIGEVLRGALESIDRAQREAGLSLGLSPRRVFWSVLMPQMWRLAVPGLINEFTSVLKATPFAYVAGVPEILKEAQTLTAVTSRGLPVYAAAALLFFALYLGCHLLFHALYRRFHLPGFEET
ncbi:MAG: amino acid ABC transporter permease [Lentisphaerae bacterium]|nr:amino acid ABC transporter permease [Lentisphaerota bacterium]